MALSPRHRRLLADLNQMNELADRAHDFSFRVEGDPPETYHLMISLPGLARDSESRLVVRTVHRCTVYLHADYPRRPPVITWLTPIVHPNILPPERNGGVCIGAWSASESLADLTRRLMDLVSYRSFNPADALDQRAAELIIELGLEPGADLASVAGRQTSLLEAAVKLYGRDAG